MPTANPALANPGLANPALAGHVFLGEMLEDVYFPPHLVERGQAILAELCLSIERDRPADLAALYARTHAATERFNALGEAFDAAGSEIETVARESIGADFARIAAAYGFEADIEELIAPREW